jgi:hypothetical protein
MSQRSMSLVDILTPPRNNWLRQLARRKSDLPAGVRVVRFSDYDDDDLDGAEAIASVPARQDQAVREAQSGLRSKSSATASASRMPSTAAESIPPA